MMQPPEFNPDYLNTNVELPYGLTQDHVEYAIKAVYEYYHAANQWHIQEGYGRFCDQFRANNAIGDFLGHRLTAELVNACDSIKRNLRDDGRPDILPIEHPADYVKDKSVPGIEVKFSQKTGFDSHNAVDGWVLFTRYEVHHPRHEIDEDEAPINIKQMLCATTDPDEYTDHPSGPDSDRTNTANPKATAMHRLRSNPVYEQPDAITCHPEYSDWKEEYRERHLDFNPDYSLE